jgi:hypothetical protein
MGNSSSSLSGFIIHVFIIFLRLLLLFLFRRYSGRIVLLTSS